MSTDSMELIEIAGALDFDLECEYCGDGVATHQLTHPTDVIHLLCTKCAELAKRNLERLLIITWCNICHDGSDNYNLYAPTEVKVKPL
jgi:hypothetical protein